LAISKIHIDVFKCIDIQNDVSLSRTANNR
jgi:hypothetical protein